MRRKGEKADYMQGGRGRNFFNQLRIEIQIIPKRDCKRGTIVTRKRKPSFCNR
jgi:hypothetical protein